MQAEHDTLPLARPVILSGIQPSGNLTIGGYLGAIRNWVRLQEEYDCLFMLVDLHAITVRQDPAQLRKRCYDLLALYIACGIDPDKNTLFIQSHVPAHAELAWILNCFTYFGELNRMTQFKDKSRKNEQNINAGLFTYPVLMAADILLYQADLVPVGADQKQHLELTRDLACRFNEAHGPTFKVPDPYIAPTGARIMSLQTPEEKMSKSDPDERNYISMLDSPAAARNKVKRAVTDSGSEVAYDESRPGIANLVSMHSAITGDSFDTIRDRYAGKGYAGFKADLGDIVAELLEKVQAEFHKIRSDKAHLESVMQRGAEAARRRSGKTLAKVYKKLGFVPSAR